MKTRRAERANGLATKQRILDVATAMFGTTGYEGTSLRQIAAAAGVNLATLKYHFGDKAALFGDVYRRGHERLVALLVPVIAGLAQAQNANDLSEQLGSIVASVYDYMESNNDFVRLTLYRLLEESNEASELETQLQSDALGLIEQALSHLQARGIARPIDTKALVVLLMTALPSWHIAASAKPDWLGDPAQHRARFVAFFGDFLRQSLVLGG